MKEKCSNAMAHVVLQCGSDRTLLQTRASVLQVSTFDVVTLVPGLLQQMLASSEAVLLILCSSLTEPEKTTAIGIAQGTTPALPILDVQAILRGNLPGTTSFFTEGGPAALIDAVRGLMKEFQ